MKKITCILVFFLCACLSARSAEDIHLIHGPYLQNLTANEVTIVWIADKPSVGWVELAPDGDDSFYSTERPKTFDSRCGVKNTSTVHVVQLKGLQPNTRYRYRVYAQEVLEHKSNHVIYGNCAATDVYDKKPLTFKTCNQNAPSISFAMVNDIHGRNDVLTTLISKCDLKSTDFFIFNGDMVSIFNDEEQVFSGFMDTATKLFASQTPMYYTRGNHETRGTMATEFQRYFSPKQPNIYYTFRQGPIFFVILDTGEDKPDNDIEYAGITDYDNYRTEQVNWLREVLQSKEYKEAPFKIVVGHMPPENGWHGQREIMTKFVPLLNEAKPDLMLCGHLHLYRHDAPTSAINFPIIVNSNNSVLQAVANGNELKVKVTDVTGKELDQFSIRK
jgi:hypothetical protein